MKISWPKGMERWKAVLDRYRYALLVIAAGLPRGEQQQELGRRNDLQRSPVAVL